MLYFAYGSNLNVDQMALRCPKAVPVCAYDLHDHELVFRGVADIVAKVGACVAGGLWKITEDCEAALDRYEGVKGGLYRKEFVEIDLDGQIDRALVYMMNDDGVYPPVSGYLSTIVEGFKDFGIALEPLIAAVHRSVMRPNPKSRRKRIPPASKSLRTAGN